MDLLEKIKNPADLKKLSLKELEILANEIRKNIIEVVLKNGGHLSSNLGTVELTLAVHYVFESPKDKIIWDVGHQSYTHKLLTGRASLFSTLRQYQGLSGFPKRSESIYDVFETGHSGTSISAALGMAVARDLQKENYKIVIIIGDGSLANGMVFEALNHGGHLKKDLIIILNDNEMSISKNVGALSNYLNKLITGQIYNTLKQDVGKLLSNIPTFFGINLSKVAKKIEESLKNLAVPGILFEELGFRYFGVIDGHNIKILISTLKQIKELNGPILLHMVTKKGKGFLPAEKEPSLFHSYTPKIASTKKSYSEIFGKEIILAANQDEKIVAITAAMKEGTGLTKFAESFPERFFDVGIAEEHAVTFAGGLAISGYKPIVAIYSTFLQRAYDQIFHDICLQNLPVVFVIDRAGIVPNDGKTHQGIFDLSFLRPLPNIVIMAPADLSEFRAMFKMALQLEKPVAIRYPKAEEEDTVEEKKIEIGKAEILKEGNTLAIFALGSMAKIAQQVAFKLEKEEKIQILVINPRFVKPLDKTLITSIATKIKNIISIEEHTTNAGFGSALLEILGEKGLNTKLHLLGIPDEEIPEHGPRDILLQKYGLSVEGIYKKVKEILINST